MQPSKYYTHFIAGKDGHSPRGEWSAVVELSRPLRTAAEARELSQVLASSLAMEAADICVLNWSRLH
jgi:hypothetical protein